MDRTNKIYLQFLIWNALHKNYGHLNWKNCTSTLEVRHYFCPDGMAWWEPTQFHLFYWANSAFKVAKHSKEEDTESCLVKFTETAQSDWLDLLDTQLETLQKAPKHWTFELESILKSLKFNAPMFKALQTMIKNLCPFFLCCHCRTYLWTLKLQGTLYL